jgi:hypothetical protein
VNHLIWTALLLGYGVLCGCTGATIRAWWTRRPDTRTPGAGFLDPAVVVAMSALRAHHPEEFARLHTAEITRIADRRPASEHPGQDGGDHA